MSKWWHTLLSGVLAVVAIVTPTVQSTVASHPAIAVVLASIWAILGNILPSPAKITPTQ